MEILALIPARGGSKGIPRKNLTVIQGKPLIQYTVDEAKKSKLISRIILSTDDIEIANCAKNLGADVPFLREKYLAEDDTPMLDVIKGTLHRLYEIEDYRPDIVILLQPTSPLRKASHIDEALQILLENEATSVVSVVAVPHQFNPVSLMKIDGGYLKPYLESSTQYTRRQDKPLLYARNGPAILAVKYDTIIAKSSLYGEKCMAYEMKNMTSVDIDNFHDIEIVNQILQNKIN